MRSITFAAVTLLLGCSSATQPDETRVLGAIAGYNQDDPRIEIVPGTASVTVRVTTYGNGCYGEGPTEVDVRGREAVILPYDYTAPPGTPCFDILNSFSHEAIVRFDGPGAARILVRGIDGSTASARNPRGDTITVERVVCSNCSNPGNLIHPG